VQYGVIPVANTSPPALIPLPCTLSRYDWTCCRPSMPFSSGTVWVLWQSPQMPIALSGCVGASRCSAGRIPWVPWHLAQVGASGAPSASASAWALRS
jgi:hypothetical protein